MMLRFTHLPTHWTAEQASTIIDFLDAARDLIWETYKDQIIDMYLSDIDHPSASTTESNLDDDIDF
jgi:hypothetical protein